MQFCRLFESLGCEVEADLDFDFSSFRSFSFNIKLHWHHYFKKFIVFCSKFVNFCSIEEEPKIPQNGTYPDFYFFKFYFIFIIFLDHLRYSPLTFSFISFSLMVPVSKISWYLSLSFLLSILRISWLCSSIPFVASVFHLFVTNSAYFSIQKWIPVSCLTVYTIVSNFKFIYLHKMMCLVILHAFLKIWNYWMELIVLSLYNLTIVWYVLL